MVNSTAATSEIARDSLDLFVDHMVQHLEDPTQVPMLRRWFEFCDLGLRAERIDGLLVVLAARSMRLTKAQERRLRGMEFVELPSLELALQAKDGRDFAKQAGLARGRR